MPAASRWRSPPISTRRASSLKSVHTVTKVRLEPVERRADHRSDQLVTTAKVPGIDNAAFQKIAEGTKNNCPVSRALKSVNEVTVTATLQQ